MPVTMMPFCHAVRGRVPSKTETKTLDFQRVDFPQMMRLVTKKLKEKVKMVQTFQTAWRLFKTTLIEDQQKCVYPRGGRNH